MAAALESFDYNDVGVRSYSTLILYSSTGTFACVCVFFSLVYSWDIECVYVFFSQVGIGL